MQYLVLKFLDDFSCLAGDCPSSCCIGWKILVDKEAYERLQIEPRWLQEEILQGIEEKKILKIKKMLYYAAAGSSV